MLITSVTINGDSHAIHSWDDVVAAINALDGRKITSCSFSATHESGLLEIEADKANIYTCTYYDKQGSGVYHLINKDNSEDEDIVRLGVIIIPDGEYAGEYDGAYGIFRKYCMGIDNLLPAVKEFSERWSTRDNPYWEKYRLEEAFEAFSKINFMLVHHNQVDQFIRDFALKQVAANTSWNAAERMELESMDLVNYSTYNIGKLVVTSEINGYSIIVGKSIYNLGKEFCGFFSNSSDVYRFFTDIWTPTMFFEYYKNQELIRRVEENTPDESPDDEVFPADEIQELGDELEFESKIPELPTPNSGYDPFYYPLAMLSYLLKIKVSNLATILDTPCSVYQLPEKLFYRFRKDNH